MPLNETLETASKVKGLLARFIDYNKRTSLRRMAVLYFLLITGFSLFVVSSYTLFGLSVMESNNKIKAEALNTNINKYIARVGQVDNCLTEIKDKGTKELIAFYCDKAKKLYLNEFTLDSNKEAAKAGAYKQMRVDFNKRLISEKNKLSVKQGGWYTYENMFKTLSSKVVISLVMSLLFILGGWVIYRQNIENDDNTSIAADKPTTAPEETIIDEVTTGKGTNATIDR
jgi:hypothetical protein